MEFPDLFVPSAKKAQHDAFEAETTRSAADILEETISVYEREDSERTHAPLWPLSVKLQVPAKAQVQVKSDINPYPKFPISSLDQSYFPYSTQHSVLSGTQQVLEGMLFWIYKEMATV